MADHQETTDEKAPLLTEADLVEFNVGALSIMDADEIFEEAENIEPEYVQQFLKKNEQGVAGVVDLGAESTETPEVAVGFAGDIRSKDLEDEMWTADGQSFMSTSASGGRISRSFTVLNSDGELVVESESTQIEKFTHVLRTYFSRATPSAIYEELKKRLDSWKDVLINIGVIGYSGAGKSTLINTLRGLRPDEPGGAEVGVVQTTLKPTAYSYPANPSLKLWDLPGAGTPEFPQETYKCAINFETYDFFIIVSCTRFTEMDQWFACEVQNAGKNFCFVRTKIDLDVQNEQQDHPKTYNQEKLFAKIREECTKNLRKEQFKDLFVALVGKNRDSFDLPKLQEKMIFDSTHFKREAMLFTMKTSTHRVIAERTARLLRRVDYIAVAARFIGALPAAGPVLLHGMIYHELSVYKEVYGLDDGRLKQISELARVSKEDLVKDIGQHFWLDLHFKSVINEMSRFNFDQSARPCEDRSFLEAIFESIRFVLSYEAIPRFLAACIHDMEPVAITILEKFLTASGY